MILRIDKSKVLSAQAVDSPALGIIPVEKLSGGVKTKQEMITGSFLNDEVRQIKPKKYPCLGNGLDRSEVESRLDPTRIFSISPNF